MRFVVEGKIVPAVRMTQRSKFTSVQAQRYLAYKDFIGYRAKEAGARVIPKECSVGIKVLAVVAKRRFDATNVLKGVEDSLNKICWEDDWQVADAQIIIWDGPTDRERLEIEVWEL